jgi:hypothetical protein
MDLGPLMCIIRTREGPHPAPRLTLSVAEPARREEPTQASALNATLSPARRYLNATVLRATWLPKRNVILTFRRLWWR